MVAPGRPSALRTFLALESARPGQEAAAGVALGLIGWTLTIVVGVVAAVFLRFLEVHEQRAVPPLVAWLAGRPGIERLLIVVSAMTLEEFHFRAFPAAEARSGPGLDPLSPRARRLQGTVLFRRLAHHHIRPSIAFARTGSVVAPMFAHGTFDAVQLFIFLPAALKVLQGG